MHFAPISFVSRGKQVRELIKLAAKENKASPFCGFTNFRVLPNLPRAIEPLTSA
jgi:hypothetical protein